MNGLKPAMIHLDNIYPDEDLHSVTVLVDEEQQSLAIGKRGQNVRLASKLCGWEIEIKTRDEFFGKEQPAAEAPEAEVAGAAEANANPVVAEANANPVVAEANADPVVAEANADPVAVEANADSTAVEAGKDTLAAPAGGGGTPGAAAVEPDGPRTQEESAGSAGG